MSDIRVTVEYMSVEESKVDFVGRGFEKFPKMFPAFFYQYEAEGIVLVEVEFGETTWVHFKTLSVTHLQNCTKILSDLSQEVLTKVVELSSLERSYGIERVLFDVVRSEVVLQSTKHTGYSSFTFSPPKSPTRILVRSRDGGIYVTDSPWWMLQLTNHAAINMDASGWTNQGVLLAVSLIALDNEMTPPTSGDIVNALYTWKFPSCQVKGRGVSEQQLAKLREIRSKISFDPKVRLSGLITLGNIPSGLLARSHKSEMEVLVDRFNDRIESFKIHKGQVLLKTINPDDVEILITLQKDLKIQKLIKES